VSLDQGLYVHEPEKYMEFKGIAKALGVATSMLIAVNYVYEYVAFCTSIIAKEKEGTLMHMRILNFSFP
jgi:hypothetical protein